MGYRRMTVEDVYGILLRWYTGQSVSRISAVEDCDRWRGGFDKEGNFEYLPISDTNKMIDRNFYNSCWRK